MQPHEALRVGLQPVLGNGAVLGMHYAQAPEGPEGRTGVAVGTRPAVPAPPAVVHPVHASLETAVPRRVDPIPPPVPADLPRPPLPSAPPLDPILAELRRITREIYTSRARPDVQLYVQIAALTDAVDATTRELTGLRADLYRRSAAGRASRLWTWLKGLFV